jgi:hypothetical protein
VLLLSHGADENVETADSHPAERLASENGYRHVASILENSHQHTRIRNNTVLR